MNRYARNLAAGLVAACVLGAAGFELLKPSGATPSVKAAERTETNGDGCNDKFRYTAKKDVHVEGTWDLLWKNSTNRVIHVSLSIEQNGETLRVSARSNQEIHLERWTTSGQTFDNGIRFELLPVGEKPMIFSGAFVNGLLVGTTNATSQWMAMRHLD